MAECFSYEIIREGEEVILRIDCEECPFFPSLEDDPKVMSKLFDTLLEAGRATKIVFAQKRDFEYGYAQIQMLIEIARLINQLVRQKVVAYYLRSDEQCTRFTSVYFADMQHLVYSTLKSDPISTYVHLKRLARDERIKIDRITDSLHIKCEKRYLSLLAYIIRVLDKTQIISIAKPYLEGYKVGDRSIYRRIFRPTTKPDFMFTKLMASYPPDGEELDSYNVDGTEVTIFSTPDTIQYLYHIVPPEFKLSEDKYELIDIARNIMAEHKPKKSEFVDPSRMREVFSNVGHDLIEELAVNKGIKLRSKEFAELTKILVRYTVGFGLIEVLLQDEKVQDITINSPMGQIPMFIVHADYTDCRTNIIPTVPEAESWASKLRMISGRPLDEANPILDTDMTLPGASARVAVIAPPLNPSGLAYAFRRHRDKPWTLPLFIKNRMVTPLAAGLISFLIDGSRTILVAGTRSAGKTSVLGSVLTEILRKNRIICIEDTLELPAPALRKLGYNIQQMKVASAMTKGTAEVSADVGIRTTLRLGDSCLFVGEVRSTEAKALYEAMRVGALANVVAGTIHGDSPYGVYDRVVNDLGVPRTSFKATDIIIVANPIKSADGLHRWRRVTQITEVRKFWEDDPLREGGFVDLMKYDSPSDELKPSDDLINGDSDILKAIAGNVKEWAGNWDAVWDNVLLRAKVKERMVKAADAVGNPELLEAPFSIMCNDEFHRVTDKVREEVGALDSKMIYSRWNSWLTRKLKRL